MKTKSVSLTLGAFDAKTRLSELLDRVEAGEVIVITRHGRPIATLQPYDNAVDPRQSREAIDRVMELRSEFLRAGPAMTIEEVRAAIRAGRE